MRRRLALAIAFAIAVITNTAQATVKSYNFSGTFDFNDPDVTGSDQPLSDFLPQLVGVTSFSGSFAFEFENDFFTLPNQSGTVPGGSVIQISASFGGSYLFERTALSPWNAIYADDIFLPGTVELYLGNFGAPNPPAVSFEPSVFIENMHIYARFNTMPTSLSTLDFASPDITSLSLGIRLKTADANDPELSLFPMNIFPITSVTLVPESGAFEISLIGALGLAVSLARARRTSRTFLVSSRKY